MSWSSPRARAVERGLDALRLQVAAVLAPQVAPAGGPGWATSLTIAASLDAAGTGGTRAGTATSSAGGTTTTGPSAGPDAGTDAEADDGAQAHSASDSPEERERLIALVELARGGDKEAFGLLYDHYHGPVYRFLYYRTRSVTLAEDLTSETFFRALRRMNDFRWQGRDFGAWLTTIARNLATDHFKAGRTRLETTVEDMGVHDDGHEEGPESTVLTSMTNEILMEALGRLPAEQQECLVLRFLQGMSIAETAAALERSEGAVKQLQLRGVRNLAKLMPEGIREQ
ncbi:sigma-70 family RNA polymerase sigma factor [Nocardioides zeae]|uniref:Sigma-70 family RNA polymerase sigma factor n=1 Tax=Nocardioides imazamoxiresistens TaxID=3231893 RepID=A0ABU3PZW7_9ACTN|nr:sigma-70 family RNA polymerase sigma factor [Nocardioides zeae]MDT9594798.1 sigma-70 family RNA polymerase sigma factor [Nocardioides zeae]